MIFVKRDSDLIPDAVLRVAERARDQLEQLPENQRKDFIKKKSHVWRGFGKYLAKMSHGKCWYSETIDPGAKFDVDHFRPKAEAKRNDDIVDADGYAWIAFDWDNFRLSAQLSNRLTKDEEQQITVGKGSWFPLLDESPKACWDNRCVEDELPLLIDPVQKDDLDFVDILDDGQFGSVPHCVGLTAKRIDESAKIYGLNLPKFTEARLTVMREVKNLYDVIFSTAEALQPQGEQASEIPVDQLAEILKQKTRADAPFCKAARSQLKRLSYGSDFIDYSKDAEVA